MYQPKEEELKLFQTLIPGATMEKLQAFHGCMKTDAVYKAAVPCGILSTVVTYWLCPKQLGVVRSVVAAVTGFTGFVFGKILYSSVCRDRIFGPINQFALRPQEKRSLHDNSNYIGGIDSQDQQSKLVISSDKVLEDDSSWNNYDTFSDNVNYFDDTDSNFQDELVTEQPTEVKKRVTYDDLWVQHRENQAREQYRDYRGSIPMNRETTVPPQRFSERTAPPDTTFDEKNTWV